MVAIVHEEHQISFQGDEHDNDKLPQVGLASDKVPLLVHIKGELQDLEHVVVDIPCEVTNGCNCNSVSHQGFIEDSVPHHNGHPAEHVHHSEHVPDNVHPAGLPKDNIEGAAGMIQAERLSSSTLTVVDEVI